MSIDINNTYVIQFPLVANEYNYEFSTSINNKTYIIWIYFNRRAGRWIVSIKDEENNPIIMGIPVLIGAKMVSRFSDNRLDDIKLLMAYNLKSETEEIGEFDFGVTAGLFTLKEIS